MIHLDGEEAPRPRGAYIVVAKTTDCGVGGMRCGAVWCGAWQRGVIALQVFKFLHTDQKGAGQSLVSAGDLFTPDGEVSTGSKQNEPTAPPVPPPTARPSDTPTKLPTVRPTDAPRHPQTHLPTRVPTNTPTDPPVDFHGASPGVAGAQPARAQTHARSRVLPRFTRVAGLACCQVS